MDNVRVDLMAYLFGDLLSVQPMDLLWICGGGAWCCSPCGGSGTPALHDHLGRVGAGGRGAGRRAALRADAADRTGDRRGGEVCRALIITSLLIIPAATARRFSQTPEQMARPCGPDRLPRRAGGLTLSWYPGHTGGSIWWWLRHHLVLY